MVYIPQTVSSRARDRFHIGVVFAFLFSAMAFVISPAYAEEPTPTNVSDNNFDFFLTIKGGISLGAYEAGLNWAFVNILRQKFKDTGGKSFRLIGITGASAGNINAFLTTLTWFEKNGTKLAGHPQNIYNNWYYNTWIPIGADTLFPGDKSCNQYYDDSFKAAFENLYPGMAAAYKNEECAHSFDFDPRVAKEWIGNVQEITADTPWTAYRREDGLLTRRAFDIAVEEIIKNAGDPSRYIKRKTDNPFLAGITLTSAKAATAHLGSNDENIAIPTHHYILPLSVTNDAQNGLTFKMHKNSFTERQDDPRTVAVKSFWGIPFLDFSQSQKSSDEKIKIETQAGRILFLTHPNNDIPVNIEHITKAIKASSAFPLAFSPVTLSYYDCRSVTNGDDKCQKSDFSQEQESGSFIDGGVFDNSPLGLAVQQVYKENINNNKERINPTFVYLNPDTRRISTNNTACPDELPEGKGTSFYLSLGTSLVNSARERELLSVKQWYDAKGKDRVNLSLTRRFSPVAGSYLMAFGAFMSKPMREYDYLAGVYDAIMYLVDSPKLHVDGVNQLEVFKTNRDPSYTDSEVNSDLYNNMESSDKGRSRLFLRLALKIIDTKNEPFFAYSGILDALMKEKEKEDEGDKAKISEFTKRNNKTLLPLYIILKLAEREGSISFPRWADIYERLFNEQIKKFNASKVKIVMDALFDLEITKKACDSDSFSALISLLRERGYGADKPTYADARAISDERNMDLAIDNFEDWEVHSLWNGAIRLNQIEESEKSKLGNAITETGAFYVAYSPFLRDWFEFSPGLIPSWEQTPFLSKQMGRGFLELLPYTIGPTIGQGVGWSIGWEPRLYLTKDNARHYALRFPINVFKYYQSDHWRGYAGAHFSIERPQWPVDWPLLSSIHLGPEYFETIKSDPGSSLTKNLKESGVAYSANFGLLADHLSLEARYHDDGEWHYLLNFNDIFGLFYWAWRTLN